jgi:hypothetical protein
MHDKWVNAKAEPDEFIDQELAREFSSQMRTFDPCRARARRVAAKAL